MSFPIILIILVFKNPINRGSGLEVYRMYFKLPIRKLKTWCGEFKSIEDTKQRLIAEFQAKVSVQIIEELAGHSLAAFRNATVQDFVPLFVERATRERLQAQFK